MPLISVCLRPLERKTDDGTIQPRATTGGVAPLTKTYDEEEWDALCTRWGVGVVRVANYVQRDLWNSYPPKSKGDGGKNCDVIDGCLMHKIHDHLTVSLIKYPPADEDDNEEEGSVKNRMDETRRELRDGDIIREVNGVQDTGLRAVYDAMRESTDVIR